MLIVGTYVFPEVFPALADVFSPGARVVHVDLDAYEIAKNFPVDLGIVADPKLTLAALAVVLDQQLAPAAREAARPADRRARGPPANRPRRALRDADLEARRSVPLHASEFMEALAAGCRRTRSSSTRP